MASEAPLPLDDSARQRKWRRRKPSPWVQVIINVATVLVAAAGVYIAYLNLPSVAEPPPELEVDRLSLGTQVVELNGGEVVLYELPPVSTGTYRIQAIGANVSALMYLHAETESGLSALVANILDSKLDYVLVAGTRYYLELKETHDRPGKFSVTFSRLEE